jgi:hypothetical protein
MVTALVMTCDQPPSLLAVATEISPCRANSDEIVRQARVAAENALPGDLLLAFA